VVLFCSRKNCVESEVNSNAIWDKPTLLDEYMTKVKSDPKGNMYQGDYISLVAGFDKMRFWSSIKYLFDTLHAREVIKMDRKHAMGFACFVSFETNGTFLISAILDELLCSESPKDTLFIKEVDKYGLYAALIFAACRKNKVSLYGSSKYPRGPYNKRGSCSSFPVAGGEGLLQCSDERDKENIADHCKSVVNGLLRECDELHRRYLVEGSVKRRGIPQECIDRQMNNLVRGVKSYVGKGANHSDLMDFIDVASFVGLLPFEAVTWASVGEETSDAYKAIKEIYNDWTQESQSNSKNYKELTVSVASQSFSAAVKWIASNVNWNFTHSLASNILVELFSERRNGTPSKAWSPSKHRDVLYLYKHRQGKPHPLYRWRTDLRGHATLEALFLPAKGTREVTKRIFQTSRAGGRSAESGYSAFWTHTFMDGNGSVKFNSKYVIQEKYAQYLM
jgi:hypothetical protein